MDYISKIREFSSHQFCCSQIQMCLALELKGNENPELIKAMSGLCRGMGESGKDCGALTGGACAIGLFCGHGETGETSSENLNKMVKELVEWFEKEYGSVECYDLIEGDFDKKRKELCPYIVQNTFENAVRIMLENGVEIG